MMGVYPPGSTVQLTDDRYAMVVAVNSTRPLKPSVLVHDAATPRDEALVLDLETRRRPRHPAQRPRRSSCRRPRSTTSRRAQRVAYFFEPSRRPIDEE